MKNPSQTISDLIATLKEAKQSKGRTSRADALNRRAIKEKLAIALYERFKASGMLTITRTNINATLENDFKQDSKERLSNFIISFLINNGHITPTTYLKSYTYLVYRKLGKERIKDKLRQFKKGLITRQQYIKENSNELKGRYEKNTTKKRFMTSYKLTNTNTQGGFSSG